MKRGLSGRFARPSKEILEDRARSRGKYLLVGRALNEKRNNLGGYREVDKSEREYGGREDPLLKRLLAEKKEVEEMLARYPKFTQETLQKRINYGCRNS